MTARCYGDRDWTKRRSFIVSESVTTVQEEDSNILLLLNYSDRSDVHLHELHNSLILNLLKYQKYK